VKLTARFQIILAFSCHSSRVWKRYTRNLLVAEGEYIDSAIVEDSAVFVNVPGVFGKNAAGEIENALTLTLPLAHSLSIELFYINADTEAPRKADSAENSQERFTLWFGQNCRDVCQAVHTRFWVTAYTSSSNGLIG